MQDRASSLQIQCTFKYGKFNWSSCMSLECPSTIKKKFSQEYINFCKNLSIKNHEIMSLLWNVGKNGKHTGSYINIWNFLVNCKMISEY